MKLFILFLCTLAIPLSADPTTKPVAPTEIKLTIHPSAIARPALRYRLLPEAVDLTPGNAAIFYLMANQSGFFMGTVSEKDDQRIDELLAADSKDFPHADLGRFLSTTSLHQLELGARRDDCRWELPLRTEGFATLLPYLSPLRTGARLLALKAHWEILDGKYDQAAHTLQTGFALAYHLNREPCLVQTLVGAGTDLLMLDQAQFWISRPGSPNLYWALADLPKPMADVRTALQYERLGTFVLPHFQEALDGKLTGEHLQEIQTTLEKLNMSSSDGKLETFKNLGDEILMLPAAKKYLASNGYTQTQIDAMPPPAIVGLYLAKGYDDASQEVFKFASLPYWQGAQISDATASEKAKEPLNSLVTILLPSIRKAVLTTVRPDRNAAELQLIEALRADGGADLGHSQLPLPIDPVTGKPFIYSANGNTITLDAPIPADGRERDGQHYVITLEK